MLQDLDTVKNAHSIKYAFSCKEAKTILQEMPVDCLLLDINLPDASGIDLLRLVKTNYPQTQVVMVTNQSSQHYRQLCKKLGADNFVDKSSDFDQIPGILTSLVHR